MVKYHSTDLAHGSRIDDAGHQQGGITLSAGAGEPLCLVITAQSKTGTLDGLFRLLSGPHIQDTGLLFKSPPLRCRLQSGPSTGTVG